MPVIPFRKLELAGQVSLLDEESAISSLIDDRARAEYKCTYGSEDSSNEGEAGARAAGND